MTCQTQVCAFFVGGSVVLGAIDRLKKLQAKTLDITVPQRVVFHHVPKCGGTSVGRSLRKRYLLSQATVTPESSFRAFEAFTGRSDREQMLVDVLDLREQMMLYLLFEDIRCVSLHVRFSSVAYDLFSHKYRFVTILREPVSRFISHYYWSYDKPHAHARIEEPLEAFLDTPRAKQLGSTYSEYYSGLPKNTDFSRQHAVNAAIENLKKFDVVGHLDNLAQFESDVRKVLRVKLRIGHENKMRKSMTKKSTDVTKEVRKKIAEICAPDIAIWESTLR
jgi:hypothetical protein